MITLKTVTLGDFSKQDTAMLSEIVFDNLRDLNINPASFSFHIKVEYTDNDES